MDARERDDVARNAARLLRDGRAESLGEAVRIAAQAAGLPAHAVPVAAVREHVRGMALEALGDAGYRRRIAEVLEKAEEAMTLLATLPDEPASALIGRAAKGDVDADPICRIRVWTEVDVGDLAALFVAAGYDEPAFATVESRFGRLAQLATDDDGVELRITRCPRGANVPSDVDLKSGQRVESLALAALRRMIVALRATA